VSTTRNTPRKTQRGRTPVGRGTRPKGIREALRATRERYRVLVEHLPVGVYRTTPEGRFIEANPALIKMLGARSLARLLKRNVKDFYVASTDRSQHLEKLAVKPTYCTEFELRGLTGRRFWVRDYSRAIKGDDGTLLHFDGILVETTDLKRAETKLERTLGELKRSNEKLKSLSLRDDLTGLHNRRGFFTLGQQQMQIAKRLKKNLVLLYLDVDGLKSINDAYGHAAGDRVLVDVAALLRATLRETDVIGRLGGDEFAVLAMRTKMGGDKALLRRLEGTIQAHNTGHPVRRRLSLSTGLVCFDPARFSSLEDFLEHADFLMYKQKRAKTGVRP
jgi:diguanylate cyclase (GGDEF)-like protein/PAS domain S-box-containing protein